jgi:nitrogen fixation/metabolism regulation signal transduction histidine kinase
MKADDQAVARGDLSETIEVEASGEIAELKTTVNGMVSSFVSSIEVTRTDPDRSCRFAHLQMKSVVYR